MAFLENVRVKIVHKIPSAISWKVKFAKYWINCKAWSNSEELFVILNFSFDKCLTIFGGVLENENPKRQLQIGSLGGAIVIK